MIRLREFRLWTRTLPLCRPFRFGIVELCSLDHLVIAARFEIDGQLVDGYAGENLALRWFVKDPALSLEAEADLLRSGIRKVARRAVGLSDLPTPFELWWQLHSDIRSSDVVRPALLAQLTESLVERAAIDAWGRHHGLTFNQMLRQDRLGIRLDAIDPSLGRLKPDEYLPAAAAQRLLVRHTVGLADSLHDLPTELRKSGIRGLKIKLGGDPAGDVNRLNDVGRVCAANDLPIDRITVDGNENYADLTALEALLDRLDLDTLPGLKSRIAWIEQPLKRDLALQDEVGRLLRRRKMPPMVIDESDASPEDLPRALELGYAGTTHKNCKGVFKSVLHAATLRRHATSTGRPCIFSGEDLTIVAPWSQAFDLSVAAAVGVIDVERNGHHYADGLRELGAEVSAAALRDYPRLYRQRDDGVVELRIEGGMVEVPGRSIAPPVLDDFSDITEP